MAAPACYPQNPRGSAEVCQGLEEPEGGTAGSGRRGEAGGVFPEGVTLELSSEGGGREPDKERPKGIPTIVRAASLWGASLPLPLPASRTTGPGHTRSVTGGLLLLEGAPGPTLLFSSQNKCCPSFVFCRQPQSDCGNVCATERFCRFRIK